jgi:hypothetical protein
MAAGGIQARRLRTDARGGAAEVATRLADPVEVRAHLIAAARAGSALTYSELLERLGYPFSRPKMRALCKVLSIIDDAAAEDGEPELAVLVVRQSDGLPGQGWWVGSWEQHRFTGEWTGPAARRLVDRLQQAAFAYWQTREP